MPFVKRDKAGQIVGVFANRQPGDAEELIKDDAPELKVRDLSLRLATFRLEVKSRLDEFARTRGYADITEACSMTASLVTDFRNDGNYCLKLRDATYSKAREVLADVKTGKANGQTIEQLFAMLPVPAWPA